VSERLKTELNLAFADDFYAALIDMHDGLSADESALANAKLVLLLANHIGDLELLREAIAEARGRS
jgi:predicted LPLAT superfamily acyltransferase